MCVYLTLIFSVASTSVNGNTGYLSWTVSSLDTETATFKCQVTYNTGLFSVVYESSDLNFHVRRVVVTPATNFLLEGSSTAVFTCTAEGDTISGVSWSVTGGTTGSVTRVGSYNSGTDSWVSEMTFSDASSQLTITCTATYSAGGTLADTGILYQEISEPTLTNSQGFWDMPVDSAITLTCNYDNPAGITPTVSWTLGEEDLTSGLTSQSDASLYTISSADKDDMGLYKCSVSYPSVGTHVVADTLYVRNVEVDSDDVTVFINEESAVVTCAMYGDEPDSFDWYYNNGSSVSIGQNNEDLIDNNWDSGSKSWTISIQMDNAQVDLTYTCKASWGEEDVTDEVAFSVICKCLLLQIPLNLDSFHFSIYFVNFNFRTLCKVL